MIRRADIKLIFYVVVGSIGLKIKLSKKLNVAELMVWPNKINKNFKLARQEIFQ